MDRELRNRLEAMRLAALTAGEILRSNFETGVEIRKKGELDLVTEVDEAAEKAVVAVLKKACPEDTVLAEEKGLRRGSSAYRWVVDPLDGTTNFAHGLPHFGVSITLCQGKQILAGTVYDPIKNEKFEAVAGQGATKSGQKIQVSGCTQMNNALCATGFPYDRRSRCEALLERVQRALMHTRGLRRMGSAALDLCYVAAGRYDVFWEDSLNAWDIGAGALIAMEAGAHVTGLDGRPFDLDDGDVLATTPAVYAEALKLFGGTRKIV